MTCYKLLLGQEIPWCCLRGLLYDEIYLVYLFFCGQIYLYKMEPSWNSNSNTLAPHRPRHDCLCYRPAVFFCRLRLLRFHFHKEKVAVFKNLIIWIALSVFKNCISQGVSVTRLGSTTSCLKIQLISPFIKPPNTLPYMIWVTEIFTKLVLTTKHHLLLWRGLYDPTGYQLTVWHLWSNKDRKGPQEAYTLLFPYMLILK